MELELRNSSPFTVGIENLTGVVADPPGFATLEAAGQAPVDVLLKRRQRQPGAPLFEIPGRSNEDGVNVVIRVDCLHSTSPSVVVEGIAVRYQALGVERADTIDLDMPLHVDCGEYRLMR